MWQIVMGKKLSTWEMWNKYVMWRNDLYNIWCFVALNIFKISFVAICAVLSRIFCRDWRAFVWRKLCVWRKTTNIRYEFSISQYHQAASISNLFMHQCNAMHTHSPLHSFIFFRIRNSEETLSAALLLAQKMVEVFTIKDHRSNTLLWKED